MDEIRVMNFYCNGQNNGKMKSSCTLLKKRTRRTTSCLQKCSSNNNNNYLYNKYLYKPRSCTCCSSSSIGIGISDHHPEVDCKRVTCSLLHHLGCAKKDQVVVQNGCNLGKNKNLLLQQNLNPKCVSDCFDDDGDAGTEQRSYNYFLSLRMEEGETCCNNKEELFTIFSMRRSSSRSLWIQLLILFLLFLLPSPGIHSEPVVSSHPRRLPLQQQPLPRLNSSISTHDHHILSSLTAGFSIPGTIGGVGGASSSNSRFGGSTISSSASSSTSEDLVEDDYPFENNTYSNTTVPLGDTTFLKCTVKNLGEREVYWIRQRDMHIISVGKNVYTNDERFHIINFEGSDDWVLQIKYIQKRDNGTYECQVSTGKGIVSYAVHVFVAVPEAFILGNGEYHIQEGSTINLVCIVEKSPKPPDYIFWYHNERMINYDKDRNLRIQTETGTKTHSRLIIDNAQVSDSGNYTCHISNTDPTSTLVYISQGDKMAAIQRRKSAASMSNYYSLSDYFPLLLHQILSALLLVINY